MSDLDHAPRLPPEDIEVLVRSVYGLTGELSSLPSERDQNVRVDAGTHGRFVLKIAAADEDPAFLDAQHQALDRAADAVPICPRLVPTQDGAPTHTLQHDGRTHLVRLVTWRDGTPLARLDAPAPALLFDLGQRLGQLDAALTGLDHPALHRPFEWSLAEGVEVVHAHAGLVDDAEHRGRIDALMQRFERHTAPLLPGLRRGAIHNDANDHNVVVDDAGTRITGLIDFGDMHHGWVAGEVAIAAAYAMLDATEPLDVIAALVAGYQRTYPLRADELDAVWGLACLRLCVSAAMAAHQRRQRPDDPYLDISQAPIRRTLPKLLERPFALGRQVVRDAAADGIPPRRPPSTEHVATERAARIGPSLSVGYQRPVHLSRGWMQYLFDTDGRRLLDAYNNVPHVGHAHPRVVAAAVSQQRRLATNTRYLYDALPRYAERLAATLPEPLSICYLVNSASEANELALRLARAATGRRDVLVLEAAYHGHTTGLIDISPYKHRGPGGQGTPPGVHVAALPDLYRGRHRAPPGDEARVAEAVAAYVGSVQACLDAAPSGVAAFVAETCPSVGGQLVLPPGYLPEVYARVRAAGGVCIADEVQTGFGRLGDCFYAFEEHGVVPDVVVLGKPIGNGHPLAAVVTTRAIADAFDNGMEFFSTFGGNPVSCEIGIAVLDVLRDEDLMAHAGRVGARLLDGLRQLAGAHPVLGDVRGRGLFLGAELVADPDARTPDAARATTIVDALREAGILIGTDGPDHNVLKIRPPMPFDEANADQLLEALAAALRD